MGLLHEAQNEQGAAKIGEFGMPGSGKTTTAGLLAIGLSLTYHKGAPVAIMDTERSSDFLRPIFDTEGVKLLVHKGKAFEDMMTVLGEAEKSGCCALIVDSVTHAWEELIDSYCKKRNIAKPEFHHWKDIKAPWKVWTDRYLTSQLHIIVVGRLGYEYDYQDTDAGNGHTKKELVKGESKMRAEGQFGYEPNLLIEMEQERDMAGQEHGGRFAHVAHILKDRSWALNGKRFTFKDQDSYKKGYWQEVFGAFKPHFDFLNIGSKQQGLDGRNSENLFPNGQSEWAHRDQERGVALEEVTATMTLIWPGRDAATTALRIRVLEEVFQTRSWSAVEKMSVEKVQLGLRTLRSFESVSKTPDGKAATETPDDMIALLGSILKDESKKGPVPQEKFTAAEQSEAIQEPTTGKINFAPPPAAVKESTEDKEIVYERQENALILTGQTFLVKDELKKIGARWSKGDKVWILPISAEGDLWRLCGEKGIYLTAESQ